MVDDVDGNDDILFNIINYNSNIIILNHIIIILIIIIIMDEY